jgi:chromosome segregation ATPase
VTIPASMIISLDPESRDVLTALGKAVSNMTRLFSSPTVAGDGQAHLGETPAEESPPDNVRNLPTNAQLADWERELYEGERLAAEALGAEAWRAEREGNWTPDNPDAAVTLDDALAAVGAAEVENVHLEGRIRDLEAELADGSQRLYEAIRDLEVERDRLREDRNMRVSELDQAEADLAEAQAMLLQASAQVADLLRERAEAARELTRLEDLEAEFDARGRTIDRQATSIGELQTRLDHATATLAGAQRANIALQDERDKQRALLDKQRALLEQQRGDNARLERERDDALAKLKKLEKAKPATSDGLVKQLDRVTAQLEETMGERDTLKTQNGRQAATIMKQRDMLKNLSEATQ